MPVETKTALVLGATGGIESATGEALARHGWKVRALSRAGVPARRKEEWEWVKGDSMDRASIVAAAKGTDAVVHAVNPPGYRNWSQLVLPMIENTIAAAKGRTYLTPRDDLQLGPGCVPDLERGLAAASHDAQGHHPNCSRKAARNWRSGRSAIAEEISLGQNRGIAGSRKTWLNRASLSQVSATQNSRALAT